MSDTPQTINGELLRLKRESLGWLISDLATRACMSTKQIRQLEEGGSSSFYSESVKLTSAKKVGAILGLTSDEVLGLTAQAAATETDTDTASSALTDLVADSTANEASPPSVEPSSVSQEVEMSSVSPMPIESHTAQASSVVASVAPAQETANAVSEQKNKTPLGAIAALFVAALAVAAWMRPEADPVAIEPPPPLQTLPADTPEGAASAASAEAGLAPAVAASGAASGAWTPASQPASPPASAATPVSAPASKPL